MIWIAVLVIVSSIFELLGQAIIYAQNISTNNQESDRKKIKYNSPQKKLYLKNNLKKRKSSIIASIIK